MKKNKLLFLYPEFYPIRGGSDIHGYNLSKHLKNAYELYIYSQNKLDGINSIKNIFKLAWHIFSTQIFYIRFSFNSKRNLLIPLLSILRKKIILEVNAPSDELLMYDKSVNIKEKDEYLRKYCSYSDQVVVVSQELYEYCTEELKINSNKVNIIENGGEKININDNDINLALKKQIDEIKSKYKTCVIWSGTYTKWQGFELVNRVIEKSSSDVCFFIISHDKEVLDQLQNNSNVFIFSQLHRDEVSYIILNADIGLAIYGDYGWSRYGFYNSSLKFYEYIANDIYTIVTPHGHMKNSKNENVFISNDCIKISEKINCFEKSTFEPTNYRTWEDVGLDTINVINKVN